MMNGTATQRIVQSKKRRIDAQSGEKGNLQAGSDDEKWVDPNEVYKTRESFIDSFHTDTRGDLLISFF